MSGVQRAMYWDTGIDSRGKPIREDVRQAARAIWKSVCNRTRAVLGDDVESAEILNRCVCRVSRYLDAHSATMFTQNVNGLLFVSFRRELWSVKKRLRIPVDISECSDDLRDSTWSDMVESQLDIENFVRHLSERTRVVLTLRTAGYEWKEVAALLRTTVPEVKSSFWREIVQLRAKRASSRPPEQGCCLPPPKRPNGKSFSNDNTLLMNTA